MSCTDQGNLLGGQKEVLAPQAAVLHELPSTEKTQEV